MAEMDPGRDPWLENEAERRTLDYGGSFPNPQNSRTRADTFGIRPDLFDTLNEAMTKRKRWRICYARRVNASRTRCVT